MSSYLSYTRGIRDKPIDTVAAVYFLQLSIADFVFWGLHLLIQTNNNLPSISVAEAMKVFILADTIYVARISGQCNIVYLSVRLQCVYIYIYFISLVFFRSIQIFAKGLNPLILHARCIPTYTSCSMYWQRCCNTNTGV